MEDNNKDWRSTAMARARAEAEDSYDGVAQPRRGNGTFVLPTKVGEALAKRFPGSFAASKAWRVTYETGNPRFLKPGEYMEWRGCSGHASRAWAKFVAETGYAGKMWGNHSYATSAMSETYWCS